MTIYDIKRLTESTNPYFFSRKTLSFFGQTMRSFSMSKQPDGKILISAPMRDKATKKVIGNTQRLFNPITNELEHVK
jgi:hypothetical protein